MLCLFVFSGVRGGGGEGADQRSSQEGGQRGGDLGNFLQGTVGCQEQRVLIILILSQYFGFFSLSERLPQVRKISK